VPGAYVAYTGVSSTQNVVNEIYDDIQCVGFCNSTSALATGTPIVVTNGGTLTRDFALSPGGTIQGTVVDAVTGAPIQGVLVRIVARVGSDLVSASNGSTNSSGAFSIGGLITGTYFAYTQSGSAGHINEVFDTICAPAAARARWPQTAALKSR
jgi:hypothetical protein